MKKIEEGKLNIKNSAENIIPYHWKRLFKMRLFKMFILQFGSFLRVEVRLFLVLKK